MSPQNRVTWPSVPSQRRAPRSAASLTQGISPRDRLTPSGQHATRPMAAREQLDQATCKVDPKSRRRLRRRGRIWPVCGNFGHERRRSSGYVGCLCRMVFTSERGLADCSLVRTTGMCEDGSGGGGDCRHFRHSSGAQLGRSA